MNKENTEELFNLDWEDVNIISEDFEPVVISTEEKAFSDGIKAIFKLYLENILTEDFIDDATLKTHFKKHCLAGESELQLV